MSEGTRLAFEKDATGKATAMIVKVPGREIRANRVE
jgi:hypothetical protein